MDQLPEDGNLSVCAPLVAPLGGAGVETGNLDLASRGAQATLRLTRHAEARTGEHVAGTEGLDLDVLNLVHTESLGHGCPDCKRFWETSHYMDNFLGDSCKIQPFRRGNGCKVQPIFWST